MSQKKTKQRRKAKEKARKKMRYITIPETVHLKKPDGELYDEPLPFVEWICQAILNLPMWGKQAGSQHSDDMVLISGDIEDRLEDAEPGDVVELGEVEWEKLREAIKNAPYIPHDARQIRSYLRAIRNADETKPTLTVVEDDEDDEQEESAAAE